jgi:ankyrin repeat protein
MGGFTPLLFAARYGDVDSASLLLTAGAKVDDVTPDGSSVLMVAALSGHRALAAFLLSKGANPNIHDAGYTPLHAAVLRNDLELVKVLLAHGANPNIPLTKATLARIGGGAETDWAFDKAWKGGTPFWLAARFGAVDMLRVLAANGADWQLAANDGSTPLTMAAQGENAPRRRAERGERELRTLDALKFIIELGADVNATDDAGNAALHVAASKRLTAVIQLLVDSGAVLNTRDRNGQTPLTIAKTPPPPPRGIFVVSSLRKDDNRSTVDLLQKLGAQE